VRTHYQNLQIAENAGPEVIKGAYRFLSQKWHPDKNLNNRAEAERISRILNLAYEVLSDPVRRDEHDEWIRLQRQQARPNPAEAGPPPEADPLPEAHPARKPESATAPAVLAHQGANFFKRTGLMLLFTASVLVALALPYQLVWGDPSVWGEFRWSYLGGLVFWLAVGRYAYVRLFHPEIVTEESREEEARQKAEAEPRKKATTVGWLAFSATIPLTVIAMMFQGWELGLAVPMSLFMAAVVGLLSWSLFAIYLRATNR
jgi:hypothetical protein